MNEEVENRAKRWNWLGEKEMANSIRICNFV